MLGNYSLCAGNKSFPPDATLRPQPPPPTPESQYLGWYQPLHRFILQGLGEAEMTAHKKPNSRRIRAKTACRKSSKLFLTYIYRKATSVILKFLKSSTIVLFSKTRWKINTIRSTIWGDVTVPCTSSLRNCVPLTHPRRAGLWPMFLGVIAYLDHILSLFISILYYSKF